MKSCHENNGAGNSCWKGRDPAQSFVLTFTPQLNILAKTFRLVSCFNTFQILLLFVQGQGQKGKQKHITKKFVKFHNHCVWLTMAKVNFYPAEPITRPHTFQKGVRFCDWLK